VYSIQDLNTPFTEPNLSSFDHSECALDRTRFEASYWN
jgi:hypothetical protein